MALYGEIKVTFNDDGSLRLDASHMTADGGSAEIRKALEDLAKELGGEWKEERHLVRNQHHHHGGVDHHVHQK